jgi:hypothetical protein
LLDCSRLQLTQSFGDKFWGQVSLRPTPKRARDFVEPSSPAEAALLIPQFAGVCTKNTLRSAIRSWSAPPLCWFEPTPTACENGASLRSPPEG